MLRTVGSKEFQPDEVLPFRGQVILSYDGYRVKMDSLRYEVFAQSTRCVKCGLEGSVFLLQRETKDPKSPTDRAHFNLYAKTAAGLVLMTKDHVYPKSKGGRDHISNLVTMCSPCNIEKDDTV